MMPSRFLLPTLALAVFFVGATEFMLSTMLLPLASAFHTTPAQASWLVSSYALAYCIAAPIFGWFSDQIDRRRLLLRALLLFAIDSFALTLAPSFGIAMSLRILGGIASAALVPTAFAILAYSMTATRQAAAMGYVMVGMTAGIVMGPVMAGIFTEAFSWKLPFITVALGCLLTFAVACHSIPRHHAAQTAHTPTSPLAWRLHGPITRPLFAKALWNGTAVAGFLLAGEVLRQQHGLGVGQVGISVSVFGAGLLLGNLSVSKALRYGKTTEHTLLAALLLLGIAISLFMATPLALFGHLLCLSLWGAALGLAAPISTALLAARGGEHKGHILAVSESLNNLTILTVLPATAMLLETAGAAPTLWVFGSTLVLATFLTAIDLYYQQR